MTANVEILCKSARGVLWVPNDSVFQKNGKSCVSVVTGQPEGKGKGKPGPGTTGAARLWGRAAKPKTEERLVTVGLVNDIRTEVRSGVKLGEKVELGKSGIPERKKINIHSGPDGGE